MNFDLLISRRSTPSNMLNKFRKPYKLILDAEMAYNLKNSII